MKYLLSILILIMSSMTFAHNMPVDVKKSKVKEALAHYSKYISDNDINFEFSEYRLTLSGLGDQFEDGDQDIEEFFAFINNGNDKFRVNCDIITGSVQESSFSTHNFMLLKNCKLKNLTSYKIQQIKLKVDPWSGDLY